MLRVESELSSVLGVLATGRNQGRLEGFTINMTSLDDIFLEVNTFNLFFTVYRQVLFMVLVPMTSVDIVTKTTNPKSYTYAGDQWRGDSPIGNWGDRSSFGCWGRRHGPSESLSPVVLLSMTSQSRGRVPNIKR